jgi:hypothetical protein
MDPDQMTYLLPMGNGIGSDEQLVEIDPLATPGRPGRALIGWMTEEQATLSMAARRADQADAPELAVRARTAREAVAGREPGVDQADVLEAPPGELDPYLDRLRQHPQSAPFFDEGWEVQLVDLRRLCSLQQTVQSEQATERAAGLDADDVAALAALTLPEPVEGQELPVQFDETRQTWVISAANPNLRINGHFGGQIQEGVIGFGFIVAVLPSFLQVARHHGRYVLRDGYHRAYGLLARGINVVPAFVRDFGVADLGVSSGLFGTDVYLGDRPPLLPDFLDDAVAADVRIPIAQKMIVIQGMELTPLT